MRMAVRVKLPGWPGCICFEEDDGEEAEAAEEVEVGDIEPILVFVNTPIKTMFMERLYEDVGKLCAPRWKDNKTHERKVCTRSRLGRVG